MRHPVACNARKDPLVPPANVVAWGAGDAYPPGLALLWRSETWASSVVGPAPVFTDTPTVTSGGVVPGDGPTFTDVITWSDGGTLVVEFTATIASADIVGDVHVFGPVYAASTGLKAKDGTNTASVSTSWAVGEVVTGVVQVTSDGKMSICRPGAISPFPRLTSVSRTVKNLIKNSELAGTGSTPTGWTLFVNGGTCEIVPSTVWSGENAIRAVATNARINLGYTLPSNLIAGRKYVIGCYVESVSGVAANDDGLQLFTVGGGSLLLTKGGGLGNVSNGVAGWFFREFEFASGTSVGPRFGIGVATNDTGDVTFSRPFLVDITDFANGSVFPNVEYVKTAAADSTGKESSITSSQQSPNITIWGDSLTGNSSMVAFLQSLTSHYVFNGGVGGEISGQIKTRFDAQTNKHGDFTIFWAGRNDWASPDVVKANIAAMVSTLEHSNYIVMGILAKADGSEATGSPTRIVIDKLNVDLAATYGVKFLDLNSALSSNATRTDGLHLNTSGSLITAKAIIEKCGLAGPWTPFDSTLPALTLSPTAPGDLKQVQAWKRSDVTKEEMP